MIPHATIRRMVDSEEFNRRVIAAMEDKMTTLPRGYYLPRGYAENDTVGTEDGQLCNRFAEPDEDAPRGYRARPCSGTMVEDHGTIMCDTCGEMA